MPKEKTYQILISGDANTSYGFGDITQPLETLFNEQGIASSSLYPDPPYRCGYEITTRWSHATLCEQVRPFIGTKNRIYAPDNGAVHIVPSNEN